MPTLVPIRAVKDVLREVRDEAREQGRREGREEATRMLEWAVQLNGHGPAVLKSLREESDAGGRVADRVPGPDPDRGVAGGVDGRAGPQKEELTDDDVNDAVTLAAIDALIEAKAHGAESGPIYDYLVSLLGDPDALRAAVDGDVQAKAVIDGKQKFGCLMADLPPELGNQLIDLGRMIPDSDLGEDGRETVPHVTIRYGFHDEVTARQIASVAETWEDSLRVYLDQPECFYGKDNGKPYDVLVFSVSGEQLYYLHDSLGDLPHTDTFSQYRPHATVAYVKAGLGEKWLKKMEMSALRDGTQFRSAVIRELVFSDAYKNKTTIQIGDPVLLKAFDESKHPRGDDGRFIGRERIHAANSDPALADKLREQTTDPEERKKLEAALAGEVDTGRTKAGLHRERVAAAKKEKAERIARVRELADDMSMARRGGEPVPAEKYRELMEHLPALSIKELRSVREKLAASFWTRTRREDMVTALVRHARIRAEQAEYDAKHADDDPLDFGMLGEVESRPTDRRNEDLNPWHETDKLDAGAYGEAQHGGRMYQRHMLDAEHGVKDTVAYNERGADVKPEWRGDDGKPVDTITPPKDDEDWSGAKKLKDRKPQSKPKTDTLYSHVVGAGGIDPKSVAFLAHYSGVNHAVEDGLSRGLFKHGGRGLDQIVQELWNNGHISGADEAEATENLLEGLRNRAKSNHADRTKEYDDALLEFQRKQQEAHDAGLEQSAIADALRRGEEDARREDSEGPGGSGGEALGGDPRGVQDAPGDAAESEGEVDTSFDFGSLEKPASKQVTQASPQSTPSPTAAPQPTPEHKAGDRVARRQRGGYPVGGQVVEVYKSQRDGTMLAKVKWDNGQTTSVKLNAIKPENKDEIAAARQAWKEKHGKA